VPDVLKGSRRLAGCAALVWLCLVPRGVDGQGVDEPSLKAAFLHNFLKFTEWPVDIVAPGAPMVACIADRAVAGEFERAIAGRSVEHHPLMVRRIKWDELPAGCALYYMSGIDDRKLPALLAAAGAAGALAVSDDPGFAEHGGMVGLFVEDGRMRFAINTSATDRARLRLSAKLLSLAKIVKD